MDNKFWDIAARQLEGKASAAEQEELRRWLEKDPSHKAQYQEQEQIWVLTTRPPAPKVDTRAAWQKVKAGITKEEKKQPGKLVHMLPMVLRVAASVAFLFGLIWLSKTLFFPYFGMEVIESGSSSLSVMLPDSSQVWLNRESKLVYDQDFDGEERMVQLEGEAFFEVKKDPQRPFIIRTKATITRVLGTSFNLRAYPEEAAVELVVATGKVAFASRTTQSEALVTPGYAARLDRETATIEKYSSQNANAWAWKSGRLEFEGASLKEVLQDLERYYGVELQLQNPAMANCRFTGRFEDASLEGVLQVLQATLQLDYSRQNDQTFTISGQGCQ